MDQRAKDIDQNVPGAIVERVGEGIQVTFPSGLLFDFDSDVVRGNAATNLNSLARHLSRYNDSNLMIAGQTDAVGSSEYNQGLSDRRAESAARYLTAKGVARHIATAGLGEREPVAQHDGSRTPAEPPHRDRDLRERGVTRGCEAPGDRTPTSRRSPHDIALLTVKAPMRCKAVLSVQVISGGQHMNCRQMIIGGGLATLLVFPSLGFAQSLGSAASFAVLAGSTVTNTGSLTIIQGSVGVSPGTGITGLPAGQPFTGSVHDNDGVAALAQSDLTIAYDALVAMTCGTDLTGQDLGGMTLTPGVYCFNTSAGLTGILTLDGQSIPNAVFVFQIGSTLTTATNGFVSTINGVQNTNVYWKVGSSATLGSGTILKGNIVALASITLNSSVAVEGRALARNGAVTMIDNFVGDPTTPTLARTWGALKMLYR